MDPKLLIWDWNGTIVDDTDLCLEIENELLRERGMREITKAWYLTHFRFPVRAYYLEMGYTFREESFETVAGVFMDRYRARFSECALRRGVTDVLDAAKRRGITQTLLSVTRQDDLLKQARAFGTAGYFSEIIGQDDSLCVSKIDRAKAYMRRLGIAPEDALFIGDTDHDAETANAVGCPYVLLAGGHQSREVLLRCGAPVYDSPEALGKALFF
jgi:phosphoglycolate phosphatase